MKSLSEARPGFTLVELLVLGGVMAVLATGVSLNFVSAQVKVSIDQAASQVVADIVEQQARGMAGQGEGGEPSGRVITWGSTSYILDPGGTVKEMPAGVVIESVGFAGNRVEFAHGSGEVLGYVAGEDNLVLRHEATGEGRIISLNKWGVVVSD